MSPCVYYIHGANATHLSFSYIQQRMRPHAAQYASYSVDTPLQATVDRLKVAAQCAAPAAGQELYLVGHSLGGVIAAALAQSIPVTKIVTLASPFAGSEAAQFMRWFAPSQLMNDLSASSPVITSLRTKPLKVPMLSIVTDPNMSVMGYRGDGVVSVDSQTSLKGPTYLTVGLNHFEVLLSAQVVDEIDRFLFD